MSRTLDPWRLQPDKLKLYCNPPIFTGLTQTPCQSAQLIDEAERSSAYEVMDPTYENLKCDRLLKPGWYKFSDGTGTFCITSLTKRNSLSYAYRAY